MDSTQPKKQQPLWVWFLVGFGALGGLAIAGVVGAGLYFARQVEAMPAIAEAPGVEEQALFLDGPTLVDLGVWSGPEADSQEPLKPMNINAGAGAYLSVRRGPAGGPAVVEIAQFSAGVALANRPAFIMGLRKGLPEGQSLETRPKAGRQGYDLFGVLLNGKPVGQILVATQKGRIYMLSIVSPEALGEPQALADAADGALARMEAYAKAHPKKA